MAYTLKLEDSGCWIQDTESNYRVSVRRGRNFPGIPGVCNDVSAFRVPPRLPLAGEALFPRFIIFQHAAQEQREIVKKPFSGISAAVSPLHYHPDQAGVFLLSSRCTNIRSEETLRGRALTALVSQRKSGDWEARNRQKLNVKYELNEYFRRHSEQYRRN
ncbi:uncharacterized protein LOC113464458 [Ceratina calcarata]|uniref:Uncharacterized protein LOC113464458 n=1 Tax=Ceratina calcarata TaxID=156304 RepID=A0AAJ7S2H6_9HYME|nr:uncharacterized protein LOC113464458 [Ceratina calcarata]